jgi:hypothetical protein
MRAAFFLDVSLATRQAVDLTPLVEGPTRLADQGPQTAATPHTHLPRACTYYLPALPDPYITFCLYAYTGVHMPHCLSCILPLNAQGMLD